MPTQWGKFDMSAYAHSDQEPMPHIILTPQGRPPTSKSIVRIHSECFTGDLLGSYRCDCGEQLHESMRVIQEHGGVLIYLRQEGRGIGLINKMKAYELQDDGYNTVDANVHLGFEADERTYEDAVAILRDLEVKDIILLTNNPEKLKAIDDASDLNVVSRMPLIIASRDENRAYLDTKREIFGHLLDK